MMNFSVPSAKRGYMKTNIIIIIAFALSVGLPVISQAYTLDQWANAIRITEGNPNYGILSVNTHNPRQVCKNTVRHAFRDFVARGGNPSDLKGFIIALGNQYCPISADPIGTRNWKHNMEVLLCHGKMI